MMLYISYFAGAIGTLFFNCARYVRQEKKSGIKTITALANYFFEKSFSNGAEWTTTFGVVWVGGAIIINKIAFAPFEMLSSIPQHPAFLFLFGGLMEAFAPWAVGKLSKKLFPE